MSVIYPDDLRLTEGQHLALVAQGLEPHDGGEGWSEEGRAQAQAFHDANLAAGEASAAAMLATEEGEDYPDQRPDGTWTVAQIDAYAADNDIPDYPATGNKADKLAAIDAA